MKVTLTLEELKILAELVNQRQNLLVQYEHPQQELDMLLDKLLVSISQEERLGDDWLTENLPQTNAPTNTRAGAEYGVEV